MQKKREEYICLAKIIQPHAHFNLFHISTRWSLAVFSPLTLFPSHWIVEKLKQFRNMSDNNSNDNFFGDPQGQLETGENGDKLGDNQVDTTGGASNEPMNEDADILDIKNRVKGMDEEAARLLQLQNEMEQQMKSTSSPTAS